MNICDYVAVESLKNSQKANAEEEKGKDEENAAQGKTWEDEEEGRRWELFLNNINFIAQRKKETNKKEMRMAGI